MVSDASPPFVAQRRDIDRRDDNHFGKVRDSFSKGIDSFCIDAIIVTD